MFVRNKHDSATYRKHIRRRWARDIRMDIENGTEFLQILCHVMRQESFSGSVRLPKCLEI